VRVGAVGSVTIICRGAARTGIVTPASAAICAAHGPAALTIRPQRISPRLVITFQPAPSRAMAWTSLPRRKRVPSSLALSITA
jgi:hypothetical protein